MSEEKIWEKYKRNGHAGGHHSAPRPPVRPKSGSAQELRTLLRSIDRRSYPAYKELTGSYTFGSYMLSIDHVQGDPFASPSAVSIHVKGTKAAFPETMWKTDTNRRALADHLIRLFSAETEQYSHRAGGSGKSGLISCSRPGQEILTRSACTIDPENGDLVFRLYIGFPAAGRTILAGNLEKILFDFLPACVEKTLFYVNLNKNALRNVIELAEDQAALRGEMARLGLIAFIADGSVLPRESGISQKPMKGAVPFTSPAEDAVEIDLPHRGRVRGMGIGKGITLIIGGGYHGKSTLLKALERGVYDHISGDGRELVMADSTAVKIRAEDGRCILKDDISPFIRNLPGGADTSRFSTPDASGSTSQAASVTEAIESGARVLLMDEDTCATNFMVRDELMQRIVAPNEEPIIPFSRTMRPLYQDPGISTILVAGSSGAFFPVADRIVQMKEYRLSDVTEKVREIVPAADTAAPQMHVFDFSARRPMAAHALRDSDGRTKIRNMGTDGFQINHETVDLRAVEQITDGEQTECLAQMLLVLAEKMDGRTPLKDLVADLENEVRRRGIAAAVRGRLPGNLAMPRAQELFAAVDRCRAVRM